MKTFSKLIVISLIIIPKVLSSQIDESGVSFVFAKRLFSDKMYDLAAEQFHQFAEQNPDNPKAAEALYLAGLGYFNINEFQKAQKELLYLIFKFPDARDLDQAQFKSAECFQALGEISAAGNAYLQVRGFYPRSPLAEQALFLAAKMFYDDKKFDKSIEILYEFLEAYSTSKLRLDARLLLAESFSGEENYDRAQIELDKILTTTEIGPINAKALLMKANLSYKSQHMQQAENNFLMLINKYAINRYANDLEINKILNEAYYNLGEILRLKGIYEKSNEYLYKISDYETDSKTLLLIGENHFSSTDYAKAISIFKKIISLSDSTLMITANSKIGDSYFALNDYINAVSAYHQALELCEMNSDDSQAEFCNLIYIKISEAYLNLNQSNIAISYLKKYRNSTDQLKNIDVLDYRIAYLYETKAKDFERAIRSYFDFMDTHAQSKFIDEAQLGLARSYEQAGNYSQALIEYQNLMNSYPASEHYSDAEKRITYIKNYFQVEGSAFRNLSGIIQEMAENKSNTSTLYQLGLTYFKELKDYRASIEIFNKLKEDPSVAKDELIYYRGRAYQLLGVKAVIDNQQSFDLDSAAYNFDLLIENYPESHWIDDAAFQKIEIEKFNIDKSDPTYFSQMKEVLTSFINKYQESPLLDKVNFDLGLLLLNNRIKSSIDSLNVYLSFQKIIKDFPTSPLISAAEYYQSLLFYLTKNFDLAKDRFNSFITNYPNNRKTCEAFFKLAKLSELKSDYTAASQFLKQIITKYFYCEYADSARLNIGFYLTRQQKYTEALIHYMDIYEKYELNAKNLENDNFKKDWSILQDVIFNIAAILKMIGQKAEAIQFYQKYMIKFPNGKYSAQVLYSLGELFATSEKDKQSKAMDYLQQLENNHSSSDLFSKSLIKLGDLSFNQENYEQAKQYYSKALNTQLSDEERAYAFAREIICLYKSGQIAAADEKYKAFRKDFRDEKAKQAGIQLEKGDYFLKDKNFEEAEKIFKDVRSDFKNTPEGVKAEFLLGKMYFVLNKDEDALEILTDLIKKFPNDKILAEVYLTLGNFYYLQAKQIENALLAYKNAIEQKDISDTNLKIGMHNLIKCYADLQLWDKAIALSREFLERFPLSEDAFEKKIQIAYYYYRLNEYDYAIQSFKKILPEADIDNEPRIQFWIGECYFGKGQFQQAITEYLKIVYFSKPAKLLSQYKVTAQYQAAVSYIKLEKFENAKQLFQRIISEQGSESVFGKPAKEKLDEIDRMIAEKK
jgi:TolA-binding protein